MLLAVTEREREFIARMRVPIDRVIDATGMKRAQYASLIKERGALLAWGSTPCQKHGHRLRDKHGHCVMCAPSSLAFANAYHIEATVYVAYSASAKRVKIGHTGNILDRIRQLNLHKAAEATDWVWCAFYFCDNAGAIEKEVHRRLARYKVAAPYGAKEGESDEVFRCGRRTAVRVLREVVFPPDCECEE
jgi:hypothetical protein